MTETLSFLISLIAGAVASVAGFGIGSLLTPFLATMTDIRSAVVVVSIPHFVATAVRFYMLRRNLNKSILWHFGVLSALGGLFGATLHNTAGNPALKLIFAALLIFAGFTGITGLNTKVHLGKPSAWVAGALSGVFGGLVGNQGGIRSAALLAFDLEKEQYVATATAIALVVDLVRMPIYMISQKDKLLPFWPLILLLTAGCLLGTALGGKILRRVPPEIFRIVVSGFILLLGVSFLVAAGIS